MSEDEAVTLLREEVERLAIIVKEQEEKMKKQDTVTNAPDSVKPVVMMNPRRVDRFRDRPTSSSDPSITEWVSDVRTQAAYRKLNKTDFAVFMVDNLAGKARQEILGRGDSTSKDPEEIIKILLKVFGDGDNLPMLQQRFYAYHQQEEDLISCSLNMVELYDKIIQHDASFAACRDAALKGRFAESVKDEGLRRELHRLNIESPALKFFELRDWAVHWLGRLVADKKSTINQEVQSASLEAGNSTSDLLEVVKRQEAMIEKQQQQIDSILSKSGNTTNKYRKPLQCWTCSSTNHINRNCPQRRMENPRGRDNTLNESCCGEPHYRNHMADFGDLVDITDMLRISAANGGDIPYLGYIECNLKALGYTFENMGFLVVNDPSEDTLKQRKRRVPGVIGSNIFKSMKVLCDNIEILPKNWGNILALYEEIYENDYIGKIRIPNHHSIIIPARSVQIIEAQTKPAPKGEKFDLTDTGRIPVQICNYSNIDINLRPRTLIGSAANITTPSFQIAEMNTLTACSVDINSNDILTKMEVGSLTEEQEQQIAAVWEEQIGTSPLSCLPIIASTIPTVQPEEMSKLQKSDPHIKRLLLYWKGEEKVARRQLSRESKEVRRLVNNIKTLKEKDRIIYKETKDNRQLLLPSTLKQRVLKSVHDDIGHKGFERTFSLLKTKCYWPYMYTDIVDYCGTCERCKVGKLGRKEAFELATEETEQKALKRQQKLNVKVDNKELPIGCRIFLRNHPKRRAKIQDAWNDKPYRIIDKKDSMYKVEPLIGRGESKYVHRREILDARYLVRNRNPNFDDRPQPCGRVVNERSEIVDRHHSDDEDFVILLQHPSVTTNDENGTKETLTRTIEVEHVPEIIDNRIDEKVGEPLDIESPLPESIEKEDEENSEASDCQQNDDVLSSDTDDCKSENQIEQNISVPDPTIEDDDDDDDDDDNDDDEPPLRRSQRSTAGKHPNPLNLPRSVSQNETVRSVKPNIDPSVLANIAQSHLLLAQFLTNSLQN
ncbi:unnamed protein product [Mytilus coruscus]|uniref:CCHC-type domain-containing protein n=1 Tax=Mytilus coruscus TaxID=42192 RepID=A0A6J8ECA6_MYTCO|nr:unnamed protein product [Mytilus coruscus]